MRRHPKQARSKAKVAAIVEVATEHLLTHGYEALSTADVAKAANVSIGTLYQFFDNKDDLMHAIAEEHLEDMQAFSRELFGPDAIYVPPHILVSRAIDWLVQHNMVNPSYEQIFGESWGDPALMKLQETAMGGIVEGLATVIRHHAPQLAEENVQVGAALLVYTTKTMFMLLGQTPVAAHALVIGQTKTMMLSYFYELTESKKAPEGAHD